MVYAKSSFFSRIGEGPRVDQVNIEMPVKIVCCVQRKLGFSAHLQGLSLHCWTLFHLMITMKLSKLAELSATCVLIMVCLLFNETLFSCCVFHPSGQVLGFLDYVRSKKKVTNQYLYQPDT